MCRVGRWSVRTLRKKIDSMLFERTALSKKPDELIRQGYYFFFPALWSDFSPTI
jgi:predicted nuclease of restriction endonuclease-like (RecB) superfamily